ncbi:MAG TPA: TonB-dependent receptor [Thermoanaerobaculia bacterium]|nr:TonB-dependent receptor [Thermoanaerobaculia bacterium]
MKKFRVTLLLLMCILVAAGAFAQTATTGAIEGTVKTGGSPLPGVTVEVRSPSLQGVRTEVSDAQGLFRFTLLPAGTYTVTATLQGFNVVRQQNVRVDLNKTLTLDVTMSAAASETITVTGAAPVVDVTSTQQGVNITSQTLQALPLARNFTAAAGVAPGVTYEQTGQGAGNPTVYGSSGAENEYIVDGLNLTGIRSGTNVKSINMDFIAEEQVLTGGLPAEYGRLTGGAIIATTKSGSNEFHGDVYGFDAGGSLLANPSYQSKLPTTATTIGDISKQYDLGANLGGYILKDRLWFFGAYDRTKETDQSIRVNTALSVPGFNVPVGGELPTDVTRDLYSGKLTFAITSNHLLNLSVLGDPSTSNGAQFTIAGPPSTFEGTNKTGGNDYNALYTGVFGTRWNVNAVVGRHKEKNILAGPGTTTSQLQDRTVSPTVATGGFVSFDNTNYTRDNMKLDISSFWGNHTVKFGGDSEKVKTVDNRFYGGGDWIRKFNCTATSVCSGGQQFYYTHEVFLNDQAPGFSLDDPATWLTAVANPLLVVPKTQNTGLYLQDSWKAMPNLTVNAGVRYETQKVGDRFGAWQINLTDNWAPRIGVIWDPQNNGRSKAYVNFGRFYESIPMDINIREFGGEISLDVNNFDPASQHLTPDPQAPIVASTQLPYRILGGGTVPVDPNLKGQYLDEYLIGYDYEISSNFELGIKGSYRNLGRVIEDMLVPAGADYFVANPGTGLGAEGGTINGETVPVPKPTRRYKGVELHATKRFSNNYQFYASYVWSRLTGNYDGTFQSSTGQLDPNINSAYDYADFEVNNSGGGLLSNDRTHMLKLDGSYTVGSGPAHGLEIGLSTHYYSGTPLTAYGYASSYRNWEYYLTPRGALGRGPADYEASVHLGFPIAVGAGHVNLLLDVFNIFNRQSITELDQRYNLSSDPICAGVPDAICNGDGGILNVPGTVQPSGNIANARASATNPSFLKAAATFGTTGVAVTSPRSVRLGVRYSF